MKRVFTLISGQNTPMEQRKRLILKGTMKTSIWKIHTATNSGGILPERILAKPAVSMTSWRKAPIPWMCTAARMLIWKVLWTLKFTELRMMHKSGFLERILHLQKIRSFWNTQCRKAWKAGIWSHSVVCMQISRDRFMTVSPWGMIRVFLICMINTIDLPSGIFRQEQFATLIFIRESMIQEQFISTPSAMYGISKRHWHAQQIRWPLPPLLQIRAAGITSAIMMKLRKTRQRAICGRQMVPQKTVLTASGSWKQARLTFICIEITAEKIQHLPNWFRISRILKSSFRESSLW